MRQRIKLNKDGVVSFHKPQPFIPHAAKKTRPASLSRLQELIEKGNPHIAIQRGEGIGDVLMTTPTVHAIKQMFDGRCYVSYVTNTRYLDGALVKTLMYNPDVDQIEDRDLFDLSKVDFNINLHCPAIPYEKRENPPINRVDLFANHIGIKLVDKRLRYYITSEEVMSAEDTFLRNNEPIVMVQPFASNARRSMTHGVLKKALVDLWQKHGVRSLVVTHNKSWSSDTLWYNVPGSIHVNNADVRELAALMVHCDLLLCPDSALLHMACALEVPTVAIFGPTHPASRINYFPNAVAIWEVEEMTTCPCWWNKYCPVGEACWARITPERIVGACVHHLSITDKVDILKLPYAGDVKTEII